MTHVSRGVEIDWDDPEIQAWLHDPEGDIGELMHAAGEIVTRGAKRRALKRTGRMAAEIHYVLTESPGGVGATVISPVLSPHNRFPYAWVHEGRRVRDRRPHRSLKPAMRDIRRLPYVHDYRGIA